MSGTLAIVGASYAGVQLAASAREAGFGGRIVLFGDEPHLPYQRPHLSKGFLGGTMDAARLPLKSAEFYREREIELLLGQRVNAIDTAARHLQHGARQQLDYDWLALATGARPRPLLVPGHGLGRVLALRGLDDAHRVKELAPPARRVCVVGGGFIGLEVAAVLTARGAEVTVLEAQERLLKRSLPSAVAQFLAAAHVRRGVTVRCGQELKLLYGDQAGQVAGAELADGSRIACDLVVAGIGVLPEVALAERAGIACDDGILIDSCARTSAPRVLAAGDCARHGHPYSPVPRATLRLESIQGANEMARIAAATLMGHAPPALGVPWFWSDQYDLKLQMAGLGLATDTLVLRGDVVSEKFTVFGLREGRVVAAYSVNRPGEHLLARKLIAAGSVVSTTQLADAALDLKALLPRPGAPAPNENARAYT